MNVEEGSQEIEEGNSFVATGIAARLMVGHRETVRKVKQLVQDAAY